MNRSFSSAVWDIAVVYCRGSLCLRTARHFY